MSDRIVFPFEPGASQVLSATSAGTARATLALRTGSQRQVILQNAATATEIIFVTFGSSTVTAATTSGMAILPGGTYRVSVPDGATHMAAVVATTTTSLYITEGTGA